MAYASSNCNLHAMVLKLLVSQFLSPRARTLAESLARVCSLTLAKCCSSLAVTMDGVVCPLFVSHSQHSPSIALYFTSYHHCDAQHRPCACHACYLLQHHQHCRPALHFHLCLHLHCFIVPNFLACLQKLYTTLQPGNSLDACMQLGPLHMPAVADTYSQAHVCIACLPT